MVVLFLTLLILILLALLCAAYGKSPIQLITGGVDITPSFKQEDDNKYKDARIIGDRFKEVDFDRNLEILNRLFFIAPYKEYATRTSQCKTYPYLKSLILSPELEFGKEDYECNLGYHPEICYITQSCKYKNLSYSYVKYTPYNGSLKILLNCMQTLQYLPIDATDQHQNDTEKYTCLILRANPAVHVNMLARIFKNVKFIAFDTIPIVLTEKNTLAVNELFADKHIEMYKNKIDVLFSDIHLHGFSNTKFEDPIYNDYIYRDITLQQDWIKELSPKYVAAMRFRPPYYNETTYNMNESKYPKPEDMKIIPPTEIVYGAFSSRASNEALFIYLPDQYSKHYIYYNYLRHDAVCMLHNMRRAWCTYKPGVSAGDKFEYLPELIKIPEYDRCLDCTYFVNIVSRHIKKFNETNYSADEIIKQTTAIITQLSEGIKNAVVPEGFNITTLDKRSPHGMWRDLPKVEAHEKYIEFYEYIESKKAEPGAGAKAENSA